ncbi:hypothetical protein GGI43DRAFT_381948 [Trichoderma evansii]
MESAESQASPEPPEQPPAHSNNIQESDTDKRYRALFEACRENDHIRAFLETYQDDTTLWDLLKAIQSDEDLQALAKAYRDNRHIRTTIRHQPASEPIDEYVTEFETRCQLFARFQECANSSNFLAEKYTLNATVFAIMMVAPIAILQRALSDQKHRNALLISYFGMVEDSAADIISSYTPSLPIIVRWIKKNSKLKPFITHDKEGNPFAERMVLYLHLYPKSCHFSLMNLQCLARDNYSCVFTGVRNPGVSYIFPSTRSSPHFQHLLSLLLTFWGEGSEMRLYLMRFDDTDFPRCVKNLLCLNRQLQHWWYDGRFALKPLRKEDDKIIVQWYWLKDSPLHPKQPIALGDNLSSFVDPHGWGDDIEGAFAHHQSGRKIETGHTFVIQGLIPEDLPAFELLELQWYFLRVAAISGCHTSWKKEA